MTTMQNIEIKKNQFETADEKKIKILLSAIIICVAVSILVSIVNFGGFATNVVTELFRGQKSVHKIVNQKDQSSDYDELVDNEDYN